MYAPTKDYIYRPKGFTQEEKDIDAERKAKELDRGYGYEIYHISFWVCNIMVYI